MLKLLFLFIIFLFLTILQQTDGFQSFGTRIPNGLKVPHPCKPNSLWYGVGHLSQTGGGKRNPFGQDFRANGYKWTTALCKADSDKDGKTNGEELGKQLNCVFWVVIAYICIWISSCSRLYVRGSHLVEMLQLWINIELIIIFLCLFLRLSDSKRIHNQPS